MYSTTLIKILFSVQMHYCCTVAVTPNLTLATLNADL